MKEQVFFEYLRYQFSREEQVENARSLAQATVRRAQIEQQKKEVDAALKSEIEQQVTLVTKFSGFINSGFEYRDIECGILLDCPQKGSKTIFRKDTGENVRVVMMTQEDRQQSLDLETGGQL